MREPAREIKEANGAEWEKASASARSGPKAALAEPLVLASGSARRRALLQRAGIGFQTLVPRVEERPERLALGGSGRGVGYAVQAAKALALHKALAAAAQIECPCWILAADTMVVAPDDGTPLGKAENRAAARAMITRLSGRSHDVITGFVFLHAGMGELHRGHARSRVRLAGLDADELDRYLSSGRWRGKAGGYGAQDRPSIVEAIEGSVSNVIGLPMEAIEAWLARRPTK